MYLLPSVSYSASLGCITLHPAIFLWSYHFASRDESSFYCFEPLPNDVQVWWLDYIICALQGVCVCPFFVTVRLVVPFDKFHFKHTHTHIHTPGRVWAAGKGWVVFKIRDVLLLGRWSDAPESSKPEITRSTYSTLEITHVFTLIKVNAWSTEVSLNYFKFSRSKNIYVQ